MAQFYSDIINESIDKLTEPLKKKDVELDLLIFEMFDKYTTTGKQIRRSEFRKQFLKIYSKLNITNVTKDIYHISAAVNANSSKKLANADMWIDTPNDYKYINRAITSINKALIELELVSYNKYTMLCAEFDSVMAKALL